MQSMKKLLVLSVLAFSSLWLSAQAHHHDDDANAAQNELSATTGAMSHGHHHES